MYGKKYLKSIASFIITIAMIFESILYTAFADTKVTDSDASVLDYIFPEEENENSISVGTLNVSVEERGSYIVTFVRNNNKGEAAFTFKTVGISAKYGEDYIIEDIDCVNEEKKDKIILEQYSDTEEQKKRLEAAKEDFEVFADEVVSGSGAQS